MPSQKDERLTSQFFPAKKWRIFAVVATGVFMSTLDSSIVNIALPSIMRSFQSPLNLTEWVVIVYLLTITSTLLVWGSLSDRLGRRVFYSLGMLVFALGSLFCAQAAGINWLIGARFLQALGAAMMMATGPAIIRHAFPSDQLGRAFGFIGVIVSLGLMTGPVLGGFLVDYFSWRAIFLVTVPIGLFFSMLARMVLPHDQAVPRAAAFDWGGALCWAGSLTLGMLAISLLSGPEKSYSLFFLMAAGSAVIFGLFLKKEASVAEPLLPLSLFGQPILSMGVLTAVISFITLFTVTLLTPFYLEHILLLPPARTGLMMMSVPLAAMLVAPAAGWLADRFGARYLSTMGLLLTTTGLLLLCSLPTQDSPGQIVWRLSLFGVGQALFLSPNSASVLGRIDRRYVGISSGLLATARNLGMSLGIAQAGLVFSLLFAYKTNGLDMKDFSPVQAPSFMLALKGAFLVAAILGSLGVYASWVRGDDAPERPHAEGS